MKPIRVVLADDHALVRAGVRALVERLPGIEVVGEARDGREALGLLKTLQPDVGLFDIGMAGMSGLEAATRSTKEFPRVHILILSMHASEEYVLHALRAGAAGYLIKDSVTAELELAIKAVARGETYLSPAVSKHIVANYVRSVGDAGGGETAPDEMLTARQREILQLVAEGHSTKEIARTLDVSIKTVETHRAQIMERLDIHNIAGLVRYAIRTGLISPEP